MKKNNLRNTINLDCNVSLYIHKKYFKQVFFRFIHSVFLFFKIGKIICYQNCFVTKKIFKKKQDDH